MSAQPPARPKLSTRYGVNQHITVLLGPTNTGKTHYAIERILGHRSGMIGFPLRLLARENYDRMVARVGVSQVALITGEEKIVPPHARYFCCTVEAMPLERQVACLAIDEVQLAGDRERGHVFTDRILHARGTDETLFMGAETIRPLLKKLLPEAQFETRARLSSLSYAGNQKVTRLQRRSAIVAFSAAEVYALAELVRRQRGGAAVVMGALSPRTRNAQVELYQNGDVDFLIATDAIGMGLNMDIHHVALASDMKFDGRHMRPLHAAEMAQIAGRAGRHTQNGTFGVTHAARPLEDEVISSIETHSFQPLRQLYWRSRDLRFDSVTALLKSLEVRPPFEFLSRKADATDQETLAQLAERGDVMALANSPGRVRLLWEVAQIPDFRNAMTDSHAVMLGHIFANLAEEGQLPRDWIARQMQHLDRLDGDIDTLMNRIAHIRTWTYITHRSGWTDDPDEWQSLARAIEDRLSDELHNRLTQRFVDRRAAHLSRRLKEATQLMASVKIDGTVLVEGEEVGTLDGFHFKPGLAEGDEKAMLLSAARKALPEEIERRVKAVMASEDIAFRLDQKGQIIWREALIGRLQKSEQLYAPRAEALDSDLLNSDQKARITQRLSQFISDHIQSVLGRLLALADPEIGQPPEKTPEKTPETTPEAKEETKPEAESKPAEQKPLIAHPLSGVGRGLLFQIYEALGAVNRGQLAQSLRDLPETDKPHIARAGVRIGTESVYMPDMLKPAPIQLRALLYGLFEGDFPEFGPPPEGRVSFDAPEGVANRFWLACGYRLFGDKVMRVDMVERVAALVRAAARAGRFKMSDDMLSLAGVSRETMALMLADLNCIKVDEEPSEDPEKPAIPIFERQARKKHSRPRSDGRPPQNHRNSKKGGPGKVGAGKAGHKSGHKAGQPGRSAPKEPDPNSPFAVLAALKK
ncbi:MAG: helicase-related protein [Candidatus Puniceispirillaceae bacterium]